MAKYRLEISRIAERQLKRLPRDDQKGVLKAILQLAGEPLPKGCRKLSQYDDVFRVRIGRYRALYSAGGKKLILIVVKASDRKKARR